LPTACQKNSTRVWTALEARAIDGVGPALLDRPEQAREVGGVVLEIGILGDDRVAGGGGDPGPECRTFPAVRRVVEHLLDESRARQAVEDGAGAVGRRVVSPRSPRAAAEPA